MHFASDRCGDTLAEGWRIGVAQEDSRPATVDAEAGGQMTPAQARACAASILDAAYEAEGAA
jgi:hypothetical protein